MEDLDGNEGPRVGVIRSAIRSIRCGACEIDAVFMEARGPLPKTAIRGLHQRVKELRQTAESAESAFREWTVELAGGSSTAERAEHDALRASFEIEVATMQTCMAKIANEVKRRKATKQEDPDQSKVEEEPPLPVTKVPPQPVSADVEAPPWRGPTRTTQERITSHASLAGTLQQIASQEEELGQGTAKRKGQVPEERISMPDEPIKMGGSGTTLAAVTVKAMPLHLKCILGFAALIVGYVFYCHAQFLVLSTSGALAHDPHHSGGAIPPGEEIEVMTPAPPRRLR
mmetsp:Transcript_106481/g.206195  ORF Transcript_106481/g.206195 Transcript_106481/m.206195 type:complete len:286 (-) Transcript_106481:95-952(-)